MLLVADLFPEFRTSENVVQPIFKKSPFRGPFGKQHITGSKNY